MSGHPTRAAPQQPLVPPVPQQRCEPPPAPATTADEQTGIDLGEVALGAGAAGSWSWQLEDDRLHWDAAHGRLFRQHPDVLHGPVAGWIALVHPDDRAEFTDRMWTAARQGQSFEHVYRVEEADRQIRWILTRGRRLGRPGDPALLTGLSIDITDSHTQLHGTRRLLDLTTALAAAASPQQVGQAVLTLGLPALGLYDGQVVLGTADGPLRLVAATTRSEHAQSTPSLRRALTTPLSANGSPAAEQAPAGRADLLDADDGHLDEHLLCLPLHAGGHPIGALSARVRPGRRLTSADHDHVSLLAALCAQGLQRAVLHEQSRATAHMLQQHLLPDRLPQLSGVELAGRYRPGTKGLHVGGDWYDATLSHGQLALTLGDVVGKGVPAAALMSRTRHTISAYTTVDPDPAAVLAATARHLEPALDDDQIITVLHALLDPTTGSLAYLSAGHPPPLLLQPGVSEFLPLDAYPPLGTGWTDWTPRTGQLPPGAVLLLYSDGLVERPGRSLHEGLTTLRQTASRLYTDQDLPLTQLCDQLLHALLDNSPTDDITLLAARLRTTTPTPKPTGP